MGLVGVQNLNPYQAATSQFTMIMVTGFKTGVTGERQVVTGVEAGRNSRNTIFLNVIFGTRKGRRIMGAGRGSKF